MVKNKSRTKNSDILFYEIVCYHHEENNDDLDKFNPDKDYRESGDLRFVEYSEILYIAQIYTCMSNLKNSNKDLYATLVKKRLIGRLMIDMKWGLEKFLVDECKKFIIELLEKKKITYRLISSKSDINDNTKKRIANFIYNHANIRGFCFDPIFAKQVSELL